MTNTSPYAFATSGSNFFTALSGHGVSLTANNGTSWATVNAGLTNLSVFGILSSGANLFAATDAGVFLSANNGTSWAAANTGMTSPFAHSFLANGTSILVATSGRGIFRSSNNGTNWADVSTGLTNPYVSVLVLSGTNIFAGGSGGVHRSTNNGTNWTPVNSGLTNTVVTGLAVSGTNLYAGTNTSGVFRSTNEGTSWTTITPGFSRMDITALLTIGSNIVAGTADSGVYVSSNNGTHWGTVNAGLPGYRYVLSLAVNGTQLYAGIDGAGVWHRPLSEIATSAKEISRAMPIDFRLEQKYPNPFNPSTRIPFSVRGLGFVSLEVFDVMGREVATLVNEDLKAGSYETTFDASGLSSGIYFYTRRSGSLVQTKKLTLMK